MQTQPHIIFKNVDMSDAVEADVRDKIQKLEHFFDRIITCRVTIEAPHRHQYKGKIYNIKIDMVVPGKEIIVTRSGIQDQTHEDIYVAIKDAFISARRKLRDYVNKLKRHPKTREARMDERIKEEFRDIAGGEELADYSKFLVI